METEINTEAIWHRCSRVWIDEDTIHWQVSESDSYDLLRAYVKWRPHREFIAAATDDKLLVFIRRWGPFFRDEKTGSCPMQFNRDARDYLTATVGLINAFGDSSQLRRRLLDLIRLWEFYLNGLTIFLECSLRWRTICSDPEGWCESAPLIDVEALCEQFVNQLYFSCVPRLLVVKRNGRPVVRASIRIDTLWDAIWWMVWQDIFREQPFSFCRECGSFIGRKGRRAWKFCDGVCAKRHADRDSWRRRKGKNLRYRKGTA
jgi:hypothetical protein